MSVLRDIIDQINEVRQPDRNIDAAIDAALRIGKPSLPGWTWSRFPEWRATERGIVEAVTTEGRGTWWDSLPFTSSIEAATILAERTLPEWERASLWNNCQGHLARVEDNANFQEGSTGSWYEGTGSTAAIALCLAVLRALEDRPDLRRIA